MNTITGQNAGQDLTADDIRVTAWMVIVNRADGALPDPVKVAHVKGDYGLHLNRDKAYLGAERMNRLLSQGNAVGVYEVKLAIVYGEREEQVHVGEGIQSEAFLLLLRDGSGGPPQLEDIVQRDGVQGMHFTEDDALLAMQHFHSVLEGHQAVRSYRCLVEVLKRCPRLACVVEDHTDSWLVVDTTEHLPEMQRIVEQYSRGADRENVERKLADQGYLVETPEACRERLAGLGITEAWLVSKKRMVDNMERVPLVKSLTPDIAPFVHYSKEAALEAFDALNAESGGAVASIFTIQIEEGQRIEVGLGVRPERLRAEIDSSSHRIAP